MPPNITLPQFIVLGTTGVASGKNAKTKSGARKHREAILIGMPHLPRDQRRGGRGSLRMRLTRTQVIVTMYEDIRAEMVRELMAFKATEEPMLIKDSATVMARET